MQPWFYFSFMETKSLPEKQKKEAIAIELEIENIICDIIQDGMATGAFKQVNARLLASVCKAMMQDWYLKRRKYRPPEVNATQNPERSEERREGNECGSTCRTREAKAN